MQKKKIALCFGTFDLLHPGHLHYLKQSKRYADLLYVIVARDLVSKKAKGHLPLSNEKSRLGLVKALDVVDKAVLGDKKDKLKTVLELKPDFVCLGHDHKTDEKRLERELARRGLKTRVCRIPPLNPKKFKGKKIKDRIRNGNSSA